LEQRVHHLGFGDVANDFAPFEDDAFAATGGDTQIGFLCFADAVNDATQNTNRDWLLTVGDALLNLSHDAFEVNLQSAASGTGNQLWLANAPACRLQDIE